MPQSKMREESEYRLPEDTPFPAVLESVEEKEIPYTIKKGPRAGEQDVFKKWEWVFKITEGEFAGLSAYGESEDRLTTHADNKVRAWATALRQLDFELGEDLNTDELIGLPCVVEVEHGEPREKKDGSFFYPCPVRNVYPEGTFGDNEPPF